MKVFLSQETQTPASDVIAAFRQEFKISIDKMLRVSDTSKYGVDVDELCIITNCVSNEFIKAFDWKERIKYFKHDKSTDIRLNINYEKFILAEVHVQRQMYIDNIIQSILKFKQKYTKLDFNSEMLINDIIYEVNYL